jgi:hypothetical protein
LKAGNHNSSVILTTSAAPTRHDPIPRAICSALCRREAPSASRGFSLLAGVLFALGCLMIQKAGRHLRRIVDSRGGAICTQLFERTARLITHAALAHGKLVANERIAASLAAAHLLFRFGITHFATTSSRDGDEVVNPNTFLKVNYPLG